MKEPNIGSGSTEGGAARMGQEIKGGVVKRPAYSFKPVPKKSIAKKVVGGVIKAGLVGGAAVATIKALELAKKEREDAIKKAGKSSDSMKKTDPAYEQTLRAELKQAQKTAKEPK